MLAWIYFARAIQGEGEVLRSHQIGHQISGSRHHLHNSVTYQLALSLVHSLFTHSATFLHFFSIHLYRILRQFAKIVMMMVVVMIVIS